METADYRHAVRIVICKYDFSDKQYIWTDNLHSTIRYLRQYGLDTKVKDIPFYIIDLSDFNNPIISSKKEYLHTDFQSICGALSNAYKRFYWSDNEKLMNLHYTVGAFLQDNEILLSKMN